jgi:tRNA (cmo5U34)-methyltransferase
MQDIAAAKFDADRAGEYERQSRIGLAGYEACHELAACVLAAALGDGPRQLLVVGAGGTGQEVQTIARLQPLWRFTAVDPSPPMLEQAMSRLRALGLAEKTDAVPGYVQDIPAGTQFDAAPSSVCFTISPVPRPRWPCCGRLLTACPPGRP